MPERVSSKTEEASRSVRALAAADFIKTNIAADVVLQLIAATIIDDSRIEDASNTLLAAELLENA